MSRLTIVVLTHNRRSEVLETLAALNELEAAYPIVLVDNGSTDGTVAAVRRAFPALQVVEAGRNRGAAGRNLGVEAASTPYVAFCDDDTRWTSGSLERAVSILDESPEVGVLNARVLVGTEGRLDPTSAAMAASALKPATRHGPELAGFMAGACIMRRQAFLQAGGYWERLGIGGEEALLGLDLLQAGWHIVYVPEIVTRHFPSPSRNRGERLDRLARNAVWTAGLRLPWSEFGRCLAHELGQCPGILRKVRFLGGAALGAPAMLRRRRPVSGEVFKLWRRGRDGAPQ